MKGHPAPADFRRFLKLDRGRIRFGVLAVWVCLGVLAIRRFTSMGPLDDPYFAPLGGNRGLIGQADGLEDEVEVLKGKLTTAIRSQNQLHPQWAGGDVNSIRLARLPGEDDAIYEAQHQMLTLDDLSARLYQSTGTAGVGTRKEGWLGWGSMHKERSNIHDTYIAHQPEAMRYTTPGTAIHQAAGQWIPSGTQLYAPGASMYARISGLGPMLDYATLHGGWQLTQSGYDRLLGHPNVSLLSRGAPRVLHVRQLLSLKETEHLIALATGNFYRSEVVSDTESKIDGRTSYGAWLNGEKRDAKVREIQHRIHWLVGIPEEFGESLYVLRYARGQKYEAHDDHCWGHRDKPPTPACRAFLARAGGPTCGPGAGGATCGDRMLTVVLYLRSPTKGGATAFPRAKLTKSFDSTFITKGKWHSTRSRKVNKRVAGVDVPWYCSEDAGVLQATPQPGDAIIFWDYVPAEQAAAEAIPDGFALHAGCPVIEGEKFIATRWIRSAEFS